MTTVSNGCLFDLGNLLWSSGISRFSFLPLSIFENPESTENFHKHVFRQTEAIYLILSTFLDILCVQDKSFKVLLKVINDYLLLKLEIGCSCY